MSKHPFGTDYAVRISPKQARTILGPDRPLPKMGREYVLIDPTDKEHQVLLQNLCAELWLASHSEQVHQWAGNFGIPLSQL